MGKGLKGDPVADDVQVAFLVVGHDDAAEVKGHPAPPERATSTPAPSPSDLARGKYHPPPTRQASPGTSQPHRGVGETVCAGGHDRFRPRGLRRVEGSASTSRTNAGPRSTTT